VESKLGCKDLDLVQSESKEASMDPCPACMESKAGCMDSKPGCMVSKDGTVESKDSAFGFQERFCAFHFGFQESLLAPALTSEDQHWIPKVGALYSKEPDTGFQGTKTGFQGGSRIASLDS